MNVWFLAGLLFLSCGVSAYFFYRYKKYERYLRKSNSRVMTLEKAHSQLMGELAHDLRTPLTSIRMAIECLPEKEELLSLDRIREDKEVALKELSYFERLIEDLFLLSQVAGKDFQKGKSFISIDAVLNYEMQRIRQGKYGRKEPVELKLERDPAFSPKILADGYLIKRLFRNAIENAIGHALHEVLLKIDQTSEGKLLVIIRDDGPGFPLAALKTFGVRRSTRFIDPSQGGRPSLGLGSVIMKSIVELYGGEIYVCNRMASSGQVAGADICITLPMGAIESTLSQDKAAA